MLMARKIDSFIDVFKERIHEVVGDLDMAQTDGIALWHALDNHYLDVGQLSLEFQGLHWSYDNIQIQKNETYDQYLLCYENLILDLEQIRHYFRFGP